jgi:hypothetical protein
MTTHIIIYVIYGADDRYHKPNIVLYILHILLLYLGGTILYTRILFCPLLSTIYYNYIIYIKDLLLQQYSHSTTRTTTIYRICIIISLSSNMV